MTTATSDNSPHQQQPRDGRRTTATVQELRVADQELHTGNRNGRVFTQLSPGAVAFLTERPVAQARVVRQLRQAIEKEERDEQASSK